MGSVAGSLQQFIYIFYEKRYALKVSPSVAERESGRILPSAGSTGFYTESALDDLLILTLLVALTAYSTAEDQLIVRCWFLALTAVLLLNLEETSSAIDDIMRRSHFLDDCWIRTLCPTLLA
jgi:hypothetical protein